ncbi:hypothetical protein E0H51_31580 [Rhizobium leguminosarum bv. viciae]|uniref:hypothetical protein n=1 Tax=Rhizobium leguminosarum TaxID=384 RepID=UPI00103DED4B|nr:hypothetical protein [Rhizobium leguminosarum]TBY68952.1 hypothetical protein E0H51_31580 [Rhizobium leguminosarum bv. viciae]
MKHIFTEPYTPGREIKDRARHATLPGVFPTRKAATPWVRTRLPLMMDGLVHLETDPRVISIAVYPPKLQYSVWHDLRSRSKIREVSPDVAILEDDGYVTVVEYVPVAIQDERKGFAERVETLKHIYAEEYGCAYAVHSELSIRIEPRLTNLRRQYEHSFVDDRPALETVRDALYRMTLPTTIGDIRTHVDLAPPTYLVLGHDSDEVRYSRRLDTIDRVFTALMQLAHVGEIEIDLSRQYHDGSAVRWPRRRKSEGAR